MDREKTNRLNPRELKGDEVLIVSASWQSKLVQGIKALFCPHSVATAAAELRRERPRKE